MGGDSIASVNEVNGGNIFIDTDSLFISDGGDISVGIGGEFEGNPSDGNGTAGSITINASDTVSVDGTGFIRDTEVFSGILADISPDSAGNAGDIEINTANLFVTNGAFVSADILGGANGDGGNINIKASRLIEASGEGGIQANVFQNAVGNGGNLTLETETLIVRDDSQVGVSTFGDGNAGNLNITATESINLSGANEENTFRSGLFAKSIVGNGRSGNINIVTGELHIDDGAAVEVGNFPSFEESETVPGTGEPGTIKITANSINLSNGGRIEAATQSATGEGANIILQVADDITLQNEGLISARALNQGNGGNLTINSNFIIAFPSGGNGNDIIASAEQGNGGDININSTLLGIAERSANPGNASNDIDASSEFSFDGSVTINNPDNNLIQGTVELPSNVIESEQTVQQACEANRNATAQSNLTIEGKGGLTPDPGEPLDSLNTYVNGESTSAQAIPEPIETAQGKIQPARGAIVTDSGELILTAYPTNNTSRLPTTRRCG